MPLVLYPTTSCQNYINLHPTLVVVQYVTMSVTESILCRRVCIFFIICAFACILYCVIYTLCVYFYIVCKFELQ